MVCLSREASELLGLDNEKGLFVLCHKQQWQIQRGFTETKLFYFHGIHFKKIR